MTTAPRWRSAHPAEQVGPVVVRLTSRRRRHRGSWPPSSKSPSNGSANSSPEPPTHPRR